jgi:hypothetical protein
MQQSTLSKHVPKLTECAKAGLDKQDKGPKKCKNKEQGKASPKKAQSDQQSSSDDTESEVDKPFWATTLGMDIRPSPSTQSNNKVISNGFQDVSSEGAEIIELPTVTIMDS